MHSAVPPVETLQLTRASYSRPGQGAKNDPQCRPRSQYRLKDHRPPRCGRSRRALRHNGRGRSRRQFVRPTSLSTSKLTFLPAVAFTADADDALVLQDLAPYTPIRVAIPLTGNIVDPNVQVSLAPSLSSLIAR